MPDEVHMMRKEIYDREGYTQRTSMPVWQARCAAQQPTRREHGLRANPVLRARTVALPFLFVRLCYRRLWPSSSTRRRGMCKSRYGPAVPVRAARRAIGGPALIMFFSYRFSYTGIRAEREPNRERRGPRIRFFR